MVDSGDFGSAKSDFQRYKVQYLLEGMSMFHYDAINLGEKDLQYGRDFLERMKKKYHLPFISANVLLIGTENLFTDPFVIKKIAGKKVGIFGVTTPKIARRLVTAETGFEITDPVIAAEKIVAQLKKKGCTVIIALAHLGATDVQTFAKSVAGLDIVIGGHGWNRSKVPTMVGNTVIMMAGDKGKYLGELDFSVAATGVKVAESKTVSLNSQIPDDPQLARLVKSYDDELVYDFPMQSPKATDNFNKISERTCMRCHRKQYKQWQTSEHYRAWQSLVVKKQNHNEACQKCHTTMYGQEGGFTRVTETPYMVNVQCVECHQPVADIDAHVRRFRGRRFSSKDKTVHAAEFRPVEKQICLKCHDADNSPDFNYELFLSKVKH